MQCYNFEGGRGWEWWNERGIEGAAPTEREEIRWVERWRVVDGWDRWRQGTDWGDQQREHWLRAENNGRKRERIWNKGEMEKGFALNERDRQRDGLSV